MKRLAFLFLMLTVFAALSFAIEGIGDFTAAVEV
jgi:hypothetical protein